jgi:hypothetical protein
MFFVSLPEKAQEVKIKIIKKIYALSKKITKKFLRKVAGNVGHYQTPLSENVTLQTGNGKQCESRNNKQARQVLVIVLS